jgi:ubiquinone/menaquinone biosynthesis C-methylase UbiE
MQTKDQYASPDRYDARVYLILRFRTNPGSKLNWIFEHIPKRDDMKILELGCGTGLFWLANRNDIPESWEITLTDFSEGMLKETQSRLSGINRNFRYEILDVESDIKYPDMHFDFILANNMLYHVKNRAGALSHIFRILKSDGLFIASTMGKKDMQELNGIFCDYLESRDKNFRFREFSFSLDNGLEQLSPFFPGISVERYEDMLRIDEAEPIVKYYLSFIEMYGSLISLTDEDISGFKKYLQDIIDSRKTISVTKDSGIFICRK